jgi:hypothetical protein
MKRFWGQFMKLSHIYFQKRNVMIYLSKKYQNIIERKFLEEIFSKMNNNVEEE